MSSTIAIGGSLEIGSPGDLNIVVCSGMNELTLLLVASSRSTPVAPEMTTKPTNMLALASTQPASPSESAVCVAAAVRLESEPDGTLSDGCVAEASEAETFFLRCANLKPTFITKDFPNAKAPSTSNQCHSLLRAASD